jgi:hypothetical protein
MDVVLLELLHNSGTMIACPSLHVALEKVMLYYPRATVDSPILKRPVLGVFLSVLGGRSVR